MRFALVIFLAAMATNAFGQSIKSESFDHDPGWDGVNNHNAKDKPPVKIRQDFGFSATSHVGGGTGEIGGFITQAAEAAYYGMAMQPRTFKDPLSASGKFVVRKGGSTDHTAAHLLLGFFNSQTADGWRTPNTLALRISVRGDTFIPYLEYYTSKWRIGTLPEGNDFTRTKEDARKFVAGDKVHTWSIEFDPKANDGKGVITATIDGFTARLNTDPAYLADGATFDRFGIMNLTKSAADRATDEAGSEFFVGDLTVNGQRQDLNRDPGWDQKDNRRTYETRNVRARFDFGYSPTNFAGGKSKGEIGGQIFRGDCRYPDRIACYGDRVGTIPLDKPIEASGKVAFLRGVSDSSTMFGFYNSKKSMAISSRQDNGGAENFLGIVIEGPSSEGFYFYPAFNAQGLVGVSGGRNTKPLSILPDGKPHDWTLRYDPTGANGDGSITVTLDGQSTTINLSKGQRDPSVNFDRFGFVTTWVDGNGQHVYLDDLKYTSEGTGR